MVIMWVRMECGMERKSMKSKRYEQSVSFWIAGLHAFTTLVLGIFLIIWILKGLGFESYRVLSGSMEPTLVTGEIVLINTNNLNIKTGDIIAFQSGDHVVIHRIEEEMPNGAYITKGDANATVDLCPVEQWQILGTMWMKLGALTHIWLLFTSKDSVIILAGLISLHIIFDAMKCPKEEGEAGYD